MFITNNSDSFHLWLKKNLIKHQKSQNIMTMIVGERLKYQGTIINVSLRSRRLIQ